MTKFGEIAIFFSLLEWNTPCYHPASWILRVDLAPSNLLDSVFRGRRILQNRRWNRSKCDSSVPRNNFETIRICWTVTRTKNMKDNSLTKCHGQNHQKWTLKPIRKMKRHHKIFYRKTKMLTIIFIKWELAIPRSVRHPLWKSSSILHFT